MSQRILFYNFFWRNTACRRLFLLSKHELLNTHEIDMFDKKHIIHFPRVVLSNVIEDTYATEMQLIRTESKDINSESKINSLFESYLPVINSFLESKFGNAFQKIMEDFYNNPLEILSLLFEVFWGDKNSVENLVVEKLQNYGIIGKHINSYQGIIDFLSYELFEKNSKDILQETQLSNLLHLLTLFKEKYWSISNGFLLSSNQVLVNALHDKDDFQSRVVLFDLLFEQKTLVHSNSESFIFCHNCPPDNFEGMMNMKLRPKHTENLKCPICNSPLKFLIPYQFDKEIFEIITSINGLLLDALTYLLDKEKLRYKLGENVLNDIELDCVITTRTEKIVVEVKMYKLGNTYSALSQKVKRHAGKLHQDVTRIIAEGYKKKKALRPILLVNVTNDELLSKIKSEITDPVEVYNLDQIKEIIENLPK